MLDVICEGGMIILTEEQSLGARPALRSEGLGGLGGLGVLTLQGSLGSLFSVDHCIPPAKKRTWTLSAHFTPQVQIFRQEIPYLSVRSYLLSAFLPDYILWGQIGTVV